MINQATIIDLIRNNYQLEVKHLELITSGYTNQCFLVKTESDYVFRVSWLGKPLEQVKIEEKLLSFLNLSNTNLPVPQLVMTNNGHYHCEFRRNNKINLFHLYQKLPGNAKYQWCDNCEDQELFDILTLLNKLHIAIEHIKEPISDPLLFCKEKLNAIDPNNQTLKRNLLNVGITELTVFLEKSTNIVKKADKLLSSAKTLQWIHADMQLENILFENNRISGIVDFDNLKYSLKELDVMFALFGICRFSRSDQQFKYDKLQLLKGLEFYKKITENIDSNLLDQQHINIWLGIFCLDQSLMHLLCAQNNVWELIPKIGFMGSYKEVLNYG